MSGSSDEEKNGLALKSEDEDSDEGGSDYGGFSGDSEDDLDTNNDSEKGEEFNTNNNFSKTGQPPPSEWIEFNKKIISMRPLFKSAKVQFANKLTRQIKTLRNRKGDEGQVEKCRRKAERLVEEISYVNRLKQDIVAKFALLHSKEEIVKIINDADSSMEYRVKAKVATMPKISKAADDYHKMHPDWRETLIKLIQLAGSKMKKKRRKMRGKGKKSRKKKDPQQCDKKKSSAPKIQAEDDGTGRFDATNFPEPPPDLENLVANTDSSDQESSGEENEWNPPKIRLGSSSEGEPSSDEGEGLNLRKAVNKVKQNKKREALPDNPEGPQTRRESIETIQQNTQNPVVETKMKESVKRKGDKLRTSRGKMPKVIAEDETGHICGKNQKAKGTKTIWDVDVEQSESDREEAEKEPIRSNVDPFFMTSDNKEFKTQWKVEPADSFKNKDKEPKEPSFVFKNARSYHEVISGKPAKKLVPNKKNEKQKGKPGQSALEPEKLHPSWQAKKKQNLTAVPFQGKKIVFDD